MIQLNGDFVEDCLWTPKLEFKNLNKIQSVKPSPTSSNGSPFKVLLHKLGNVQVELRNFQITIPCNMEFADYPFDQQVKILSLKFQPFAIEIILVRNKFSR